MRFHRAVVFQHDLLLITVNKIDCFLHPGSHDIGSN